jgi:hypothetical protein
MFYSIILRAERADNDVSNGVYLVLTVTYTCKIIKCIKHEKERSCTISPFFLSGIDILTYKPVSIILKKIDIPLSVWCQGANTMPDSLFTDMDSW